MLGYPHSEQMSKRNVAHKSGRRNCCFETLLTHFNPRFHLAPISKVNSHLERWLGGCGDQRGRWWEVSKGWRGQRSGIGPRSRWQQGICAGRPSSPPWPWTGSIPLENPSDPSLPSPLLSRSFSSSYFPSVLFSEAIISPIFTSFSLPQPYSLFNRLSPCSSSFSPALMKELVSSWYWPRRPCRTPRLPGPAENGQAEITWAPYCLNSILLSWALSLIFTLVHRRLQKRFRQLHTWPSR